MEDYKLWTFVNVNSSKISVCKWLVGRETLWANLNIRLVLGLFFCTKTGQKLKLLHN